MPAKVDKEKCTGCGVCVDACPQDAISLNDVAEIDAEKCTDCGTCVEECPNEALSMPG
jgi:ferredoxin